MHEILAQVFTYVWGVWRHRWLALAVAWLVAVGGWIWVWKLPESYVASAQVYVDTNSILKPLLRGMAIQPDYNQRVSLLSRSLLSRPNLEKLMRMTDLDLQATDAKQKEAMLSELQRTVALGGSRNNPSMYFLRVSHKDRQTAQRIAQSLLTIFVEGSLGDNRGFTTGAQGFLDQQITEHEARMIAAERRVVEFKRENMAMLPGSSGGYYGSLENAKAELEQARLQLSEMENRRQELQRQLDGEKPMLVPSGATSPEFMTPLDSRIHALRAKVDQLLTRYTDKHPEVVQSLALIAELESEKVLEYDRMSEDGSGLANSPVYQGMRNMLAETEAKVAELDVRVAQYEQRVTELQDKLNAALDIEAKYKQLDRDYNVIAGRYKQLLSGRETAQMSEDVEQTASDLSFKVIEPVFVPSKPTEPDKVTLNAGVLLAGIGAGVAAALLFSLVAPVFSDPRSLIAVSGLPLLGTVTLKQQPQETRRENYALAAYSVLGIGLLLAYAGVSLGPGVLFT